MRITNETKALLGRDRTVLALSLLHNETRKKTITIRDTANTAVNLSSYTFEFRAIRRDAATIEDTRNGLNITGLTTFPGATEINLDTFVTKLPQTGANVGKVEVFWPTTLTSTEPSDPDTAEPIIYTGYIGINSGNVGAANTVSYKITHITLVSNDGVST